MVNKYFTLFVLVIAALAAQSQNYNMSNTTVQACGGTFYDNGGAGGNYSNGATLVMTFQATTPGDAVCLDFLQWDLDYSIFGYAEMSFYDGSNTGAPLIMTATGDWTTNPGGGFDFTGPGMVCSTTGDLTVEFNPDGAAPGWEAAISCYTPALAPGCNITATASAINICQGDSVNLSAIGNLINVPLDNNFNNSTVGVGWNSTVNAVFNNPCGPGLDGSPHLWMGIEPFPRTLTSQVYDVSNGGVISFDFKMATQANAAPCEGPDLDDEGVYLQYSTNGGAVWSTIHYFFPPFYTDGSSHGLNWQNYVFNVPPAAQTTSTEFRWVQNDGSSASTDHWGIDNVQISYPTTATISWDQGLGLGADHTAFPLATTTYTASITDGVLSCDASVTVTVNPCGCNANVGNLNAYTTGNTNNNNTVADQFILCDGDHFLVDTVSGYGPATGGNPALDYAIYVCPPTPGVHPHNDPCFSGSFIETPPGVDEINNGGINSNIITYLSGIGQTVTNNTVWIVPITLSVAALNANEYDSTCYDLGTAYEVTYLNPITTSDVVDCAAGTVVVTINGGYTEFFAGYYNLTNTGAGTLSTTAVNASGGSVTISGLANGDNYSFTILDDNNCPVTYAGGNFLACACTADAGTITVTGNGTLVGVDEYDLTDCNTINFAASAYDLDGGDLTYGWAVFSCEPSLPFTAAQILDFTNHPCYLGQASGPTTNDFDAGGISGTITGAYDTLYILPYTSETSSSGSLDDDGDGCYDYGNLIQINYLPPSCGDCTNPTCNIGSVNEFADRTYLSCDDPCADLNDITHITYHTVTTDAFGNVGVVQQLNFNQIMCSGITRSAVLRATANSCGGPDILPSTLNANAVGSGFNPEWIGLTPNTTYTLIITTVIGSNCDYDYGCVDYYGIPGCAANVGNTTVTTTDPTNNDYVLCFNEEIDLATVGFTLPAGAPAAGFAYALYDCAPTIADPATAPCFTGQYVIGAVANSINDGTFAAALAAPNQTVWLVPITMDDVAAPGFNHDADGDGCFVMGTPIEISYLNEITTTVTPLCASGELNVQIAGGYPEFFTGNYNITNNGAGNLNASTLATHNGVVTLGGLSNGMNYDLSIVDDNGCTVTNVLGTYVSAVIDSIPFINPGCNNNDGQLEVFASSTTGAVDYKVNGVLQSGNPVFTGLAGGSYLVQITDANACTDTATVVLLVASPILFDADSVDVLCFGQNTGSILFSNVTGGDGVYNYSIDNGITTQTSPTFTNLTAGVYQLLVSDNSGCSLSSTITINEPPALLLTNFVINDVSCNGLADGSVAATINGGSPLYNYTWSNGLAGINASQAVNVSAGTYSLTITDVNGCSVDTLNFVVNEPAPIAVDSIVVSDELCFGQCDGSISIYSPNASLYGFNGGAMTAANQLTNLCSGVYTLEISDAAGCQFDTTATIGSPQALTVVADADLTLCIGENVNLGATATGGTGAIVYTWDNGLGAGQNPNVAPVTTTIYNVIATDANGCVAPSEDQIITVRNPLSVQAFNDTTICFGTSVDVNALASGGDGNYSFNWNNGAGVGSSVLVSPNTTTTYTVTVSDLCGTPSANATVTVSIQDLPNVSFSNSFSGCETVQANFMSDDVNNPALYNATFQWDLGNGIVVQNRDSVVYTYNTPGCFDVTYTISDSIGCTNSFTQQNAACIYQNPVADFSFTPENIDLMNTEVEFTDASSGSSPFTYLWTFSENVSPGSSAAMNPTITFPSENQGVYTACLLIEDQNLCVDSICKEVNIGGVLFFYVPNAFTPDGNGENDVFKSSITGVDVTDFVMTIYDRWGELIFTTIDKDEGWDGTFKGGVIKQDVYVWKISFKNPVDGRKENKVGRVTIIQ